MDILWKIQFLPFLCEKSRKKKERDVKEKTA